MKRKESKKPIEMIKVLRRLAGFLGEKAREFREDRELVPLEYRTFEIPKSLFGRLKKDTIIAVCNIINDSDGVPFLLSHEWSDDQREMNHSILGHWVDLSVKTPVSSLLGKYVMANWAGYAHFGIFVAKITEVNQKPFVDLRPDEQPELFMEILFYSNGLGEVVEPKEPIRPCCDRYMLSMVFGELTDSDLQELKRICQTKSSCEL